MPIIVYNGECNTHDTWRHTMTLEEAFENDQQARAEFEEYLDEMAGDHVHVAARNEAVHEEDFSWEDDGQPTEYDEWQDYMGGDDWDHGQYDDGGY